MSIPRSSDKKELYLIKTVSTGPSDVYFEQNGKGPTGFNIYGNPQTGLPEAGITNKSIGLQLVASGGFVEEEIDKIQSGQNKLTLSIDELGTISPSKGSGAIDVPRYSLKYANNQTKHSLNTAWNFLSEVNINAIEAQFAELDTETYSLNNGARVGMVEDTETGIVYLFVVAEIVGQSDYRILVFSYEPTLSSAPDFSGTGQFTNAAYSAKLIGQVGLTNLKQPQIDACMGNGVIYILVSHYGDETAPADAKYGDVHLFQFDFRPVAGEPRVTLLSKDIAAQTGGKNQRFDGGVSIQYAYGRVIIATGILDTSKASSAIEQRDILIGSSPDGIHWSFTENNTNALGIISSEDSLLKDAAIRSIDRARSEDTPLMCAVGEKGAIFISTDDGATWSAKASFASRNSITLLAVKIIQSEEQGKYIVYAGGANAYLTRSLDSGLTWKVVSYPSGFFITDPSSQFTFSDDDFELNAKKEPVYQTIQSLNSGFGFPTVHTHLSNIQTMDAHEWLTGDVVSGNTNAGVFFTSPKAVFWIQNAHKKAVLNLDSEVSGDIKYIAGFGQLATTTESVINGMAVLDRTQQNPSILLTGRFVSEEGANASKPGGFIADEGYQTNISHFVRMTGATHPYRAKYKAAPGFLFSTDENEVGLPYTSPTVVSPTLAYAITREGELLQWIPDYTADTHLVGGPTKRDQGTVTKDSDGKTLIISTVGLTGITHFKKADDSPDNFLLSVGSTDGFVYTSTDKGQSWDVRSIAVLGNVRVTTGAGVTAVGSNAYSLIHLSEENILVAGDGGIYITNSRNRTRPFLFLSSQNILFLANAELDTGNIELWRTEESLLSDKNLIPVFEKVYPLASKTNEVTPIKFKVQTDLTPLWSEVPYPSLMEMEDMLHIFTPVQIETHVAGRVVATVDNGDNTFPCSATRVPLPMSPLVPVQSTWSLAQHRKTLRVFPHGGGRLLGISMSSDSNGKVGLFTSRTWGIDPVDHKFYFYAPVIPGQWQWMGTGNLQTRWLGKPRLGDSFTIPIEYQYGKDNLSIESPTFSYRIGPDSKIPLGVRTDKLHLVWDRQDAFITSIVGKGHAWNAHALGLIKTNFPEAFWAISIPTYNGTAFPIDRADYTEMYLNAIVHQGTFLPQTARETGANKLSKNIIMDTSLALVPNEYASGGRTYYLLVAKTTDGISNPDPTKTVVRKITGNTSNMIMYEGEPIFAQSDTLTTVFEYMVYTDRMFSDGSGGTRTTLSGNPEPPLANSEYEFGRWLRVTIPRYYTLPENYHIFGKVMLGRINPVSLPLASQTQTRHRFSRGWRWTAVPRTVLEDTPEGVSYAKKIGDAGQAFRLQWDNIDSWEADVFYGLLLPNMHQAFCLVFDSDTPTSIELVRIRDTVDVEHVAGRIFNHGVILHEVQ
jgi:hypothetical protein